MSFSVRKRNLTSFLLVDLERILDWTILLEVPVDNVDGVFSRFELHVWHAWYGGVEQGAADVSEFTDQFIHSWEFFTLEEVNIDVGVDFLAVFLKSRVLRLQGEVNLILVRNGDTDGLLCNRLLDNIELSIAKLSVNSRGS